MYLPLNSDQTFHVLVSVRAIAPPWEFIDVSLRGSRLLLGEEPLLWTIYRLGTDETTMLDSSRLLK